MNYIDAQPTSNPTFEEVGAQIIQGVAGYYHGSMVSGQEVMEKHISVQKDYNYERANPVPVGVVDEEEKTFKNGYITLYTKFFHSHRPRNLITGYDLKKKGTIKKMKGANSSKWMYTRSTADIPLKWNAICNADIIPNRSYMRSIADIPKLSAIAGRRKE